MDEEKNELIEMNDAPAEDDPEILEEAPAGIPEEASADAPEKKSTGLNMQTRCLLRILVGGYIAYLGWQLLQSYFKGAAASAAVNIIFGALFLLLGGGLAVWSLLLMFRNDS